MSDLKKFVPPGSRGGFYTLKAVCFAAALLPCLIALPAGAAPGSGGGSLTPKPGAAALDDYSYTEDFNAYLEARALKQRQAGKSPAHIPSEGVAYTKATAVNSAGLSRMREGQPEAAATVPLKGVGNFSKDIFSRPGDDLAKAGTVGWGSAKRGNTIEDEEKKIEPEDDAVNVSGGMHPLPADRFEPQNSPLPGTRHTMANEEHVDAPEMNISLKVSDTTRAKVSLNPQDQSSPLYQRVAKEDALNATGVYLEYQVKENVQLHVGGEVHKYTENEHEENSGTGAVMGLRWNF